ncbi:jg15244 [Pararge aegeria aegeria]|uniref:Jg15244 protein n=1 Tax=Pararge aegeria aegeria TaxID=348720 RepID=A0A8S4QHP1_9NEOP|nr:jg15244 [Pararge aegeria aegeria]
MNDGATCDAHGRSGLITSYIQYQCRIPRPSLSDRDIGLPLPPSVLMDGSCKILHEELALQWVVASGATRDLAMQNSCQRPTFRSFRSGLVKGFGVASYHPGDKDVPPSVLAFRYEALRVEVYTYR